MTTRTYSACQCGDEINRVGLLQALARLLLPVPCVRGEGGIRRFRITPGEEGQGRQASGDPGSFNRGPLAGQRWSRIADHRGQFGGMWTLKANLRADQDRRIIIGIERQVRGDDVAFQLQHDRDLRQHLPGLGHAKSPALRQLAAEGGDRRI